MIQKKIVSQINEAKCFSVMADETTDVSSTEQLSLCARYIFQSNIREEFLTFVPVTNLTGEGLADSILSTLLSMGIDLTYLRGQSYDGASAMSGIVKGVKTRILEKYPKATYSYCANHCLNLVLSDACSQQNVRNMIGTIKETNFFSRSALRHSLLTEFIQGFNEKEKTKYVGLVQLCETRWVERHESIIRFGKLLENVLQALEYIESTTNDRETRSKSHLLQKALTTFDFVISLQCATKLLSLSLPLSRKLQGKTADLQICYQLITELTATLLEIRANSIAEFETLFTRSREIADELGFEITVPRVCKRQNYRKKATSNDPKTYYRETVFLPFLDQFIDSVTSRFENHASNVSVLLNFIPSLVKASNIEEIKTTCRLYGDDLSNDFDIIEGEYTLWKNKWDKVKLEEMPDSVLEALDDCDIDIYPNIHKLLTILCTLPISTASVERTFSNLRRLKTYLRSTMSQDRMTGLALLNIYYNHEINNEHLIEEFKKKNRNILL